MALDNPPFRSAAEIAVEFHTAVPDALFRSYLDSQYSVSSLSDLINLTGVVDIRNTGVTNATGIGYALGITQLLLPDNKIVTTDDVSGTTLLTQLYYSGNSGLTSIGSVERLESLVVLVLNNCALTTIGDVSALVNLVVVRLQSNQFAQSELEILIDAFYANRVVLGALSCNINMSSNPGSVDAAASKSVEIAALIAAGCTVTI